MLSTLVRLAASVWVAAAFSCEAADSAKGPGESSQREFQNPSFACPTERVVDPQDGYPHPIRQFPYAAAGERSVAELEAFCERMQERFAESGMTEEEADLVYEAIPKVLTIADGSYGMPSPEEPVRPAVVLRERVMVRKVEEGSYEIFYYTEGCGRNYSVYEIRIRGENVELIEVERWSESFPC